MHMLDIPKYSSAAQALSAARTSPKSVKRMVDGEPVNFKPCIVKEKDNELVIAYIPVNLSIPNAGKVIAQVQILIGDTLEDYCTCFLDKDGYWQRV